MKAGCAKLSRREVLAAACAGAVLALPRHCEERSDAAIQCDASGASAAGLLPPACAGVRNDGAMHERWRKALARFARAVAELEGVAHTEDDDLYDRALGRHNAALARLLRSPAPDLAAVERKLDLILRHTVFELTFGESCLAALRRDIERFAAAAGDSR
jgi:hypothetical protein